MVMHRLYWNPKTSWAHEAIYQSKSGKPGQFHHLFAAGYRELGFAINDRDVLKGISKNAGIDQGDVSPRIRSGVYHVSVLCEYDSAKEKGSDGTPTYMIGGELHSGDVTIDELREAISAASGA